MAKLSRAIMASAGLVPFALAQSSGSIPPCLNHCLKQTTQPCTTSSLPLLINCINSDCPADSDVNSQSSRPAASMSLTYAPKVQYSCQQSFLPGSSEETPLLNLTGDGACTTSPYNFQSLFVSVHDDSHSDTSITLSKVARQCAMMLYPVEGCKGQETKLDLSNAQGDRCIFQGGRSAKLICTVLRAPDSPSYASILSTLCSNDGVQPNATVAGPAGSNSTSPYGSTGSGRPSNATSSTTEPAMPSLTSRPYMGRASSDQVAKPSLIALVALFAVAILVL